MRLRNTDDSDKKGVAPSYGSVVVIGSSPLCLIASLAFRHLGCNTYLIYEKENLGGAWSSFEVDGKHIEESCHLLESDATVHSFLSILGIQIYKVVGDKAPVVVSGLGMSHERKYHSRVSVAIFFLKALERMARCMVRSLVPGKTERLNNLKRAFAMLIRAILRLPQLVWLEPLHMPEYGWGSLVERLILEAQRRGICLIEGRVTGIDETIKGQKEFTLKMDAK